MSYDWRKSYFNKSICDGVVLTNSNGNIIVKLEPSLYRGSESSSIVGDSKKARISLDWEPSYSFYSLVDEMCANDKNLVIKKSNI